MDVFEFFLKIFILLLRRLSLSKVPTSAPGVNRLRKAKTSVSRQNSELKELPTDLKMVAVLKFVNFHMMTSKRNLAKLKIETVEASWIQNKLCKKLKAQMIKFEVLDQTRNQTNYKKIAESMDKKVFDAEICLYDLDPTVKEEDLSKVDVDVKLEMGKIRLVFLMKFINDFLAFIEPFSRTREIVAEQAGIAYEEAEKRLLKAYANKTRAKLNVRNINIKPNLIHLTRQSYGIRLTP